MNDLNHIHSIAKNIELVISDVDGVLSTGLIYMGNDGEELKTFHTRDGHGIKALMNHGIEFAVITGRQSKIVSNRMTSLGVKRVFQGNENKHAAFDSILQELNLPPNQVAFIGDDLPDLPFIRKVGLGVAVADALPVVVENANYVTQIKGGHGAVREVCDLILEAKGLLEAHQSKYM